MLHSVCRRDFTPYVMIFNLMMSYKAIRCLYSYPQIRLENDALFYFGCSWCFMALSFQMFFYRAKCDEQEAGKAMRDYNPMMTVMVCIEHMYHFCNMTVFALI